jgi:hypothetical protein
MRFILLLSLFLSTASSAQVKESNGRFSNYSTEGNLAITTKLGCISLSATKNVFTAADLYQGVTECLQLNNFQYAADLFMLAGAYSAFDAARVVDRTAGQAKTVLLVNAFAKASNEQKLKFNEALAQNVGDKASLETVCTAIKKTGSPDYYPKYMISHGVMAFNGNSNDTALIKDLDYKKLWLDVQTQFLGCQP